MTMQTDTPGSGEVWAVRPKHATVIAGVVLAMWCGAIIAAAAEEGGGPADKKEKTPRGASGGAARPENEPETDAEAEARARDGAIKNFQDLITKNDANQDGKLSMEELAKRKSVTKWDSNGDGQVDQSEFIAGRMQQFHDRKQRAREAEERRLAEEAKLSPREQAQRVWMRSDKNRDGRLVPEEKRDLFGGAGDADANGDNTIYFEELVVHYEHEVAVREATVRGNDKNADGKLTADEAPALFARYSRADQDGDKALSGAELEAGVAAEHKARRAEIAQPAEARHGALDSDKDGKVSAAEVKHLAPIFPNLDGDKDGTVTLAEFQAAITAAPAPPDMFADHGREMLRRHDKDLDGKLSGEEAAQFLARFPDADANGDGALDLDEVQAILRKDGERTHELGQGGLQFGTFDRNQDGKITKDEQATLVGIPGLDKDGNEEISQEEFDAHFKKPRRPKDSMPKDPVPKEEPTGGAR